VLALLAELQQEMRSMLMIVTHSPSIAAEFPRQYAMRERRLERTA
jgi:ABC-type lipoprotein export system ATPase subunit